jgi:hypothetical protein
MPGGKDWPALSATKHTFACGVYFGLMGNSEKAHQWLDQVQKHNPQYAGIEEALKALDE